jgi:hypothetical protein
MMRNGSRATSAPSPARDPVPGAEATAEPTDSERQREYEQFKPSLELSARATRAVLKGLHDRS